MNNPAEGFSQEAAQAMFDELARIAVAVGRSKDGTGLDVDWHDLAGDVRDLARGCWLFSGERSPWCVTHGFDCPTVRMRDPYFADVDQT